MYTVHECYGGWYREPVNRKCRLLPICIFIVPPPLHTSLSCPIFFLSAIPHSIHSCTPSNILPHLHLTVSLPVPSCTHSNIPMLPHLLPIRYTLQYPFLYPFKDPYPAPFFPIRYTVLYSTVSLPLSNQTSLSCPILFLFTISYRIPSCTPSNISRLPHKCSKLNWHSVLYL